MTKSFVLGLTFLSGLAAQVTITSSSPLTAGVATVPYSFTLAATGGTAPYSWTLIGGALPGGIGLALNGQVSGTANTATVANFTVQAADSSSTPLTATMAFSLTIAPQITTTTLPASTVNEPYPNGVQLSAVGLSGTPAWSAVGLPSGMSISPSGVLGGTPTASGSVTPTFSVTDPSGAVGTANIPLTINAAPTITDTSPLTSGDVAVPYSYQFGSSPVSGGTPPYSWSTPSTLPPGLTLNSSGLLAGTPTATGLYTFSIKVTDFSTATGSKTFALVIGTLPVQVTLLKSPPASTVGVPYPPPPAAGQPPYFQASRGTGNGYTWTATGLPPGLSVSPTSGSTSGLTGTPAAAGTLSGSVTVTDSADETGSVGVTITINPVPAINTSPLQACTAGTFCSRTLSLTGGTAPFVWSLASGSVPPGMSLSNAGVISGTPSAVASPTQASFSVTVTDVATAANTQPFTLLVNPAITFTPSTLPATTSGVAYSQTFTSSGGTGTISFTATGLPSWLNLSSGGQLSGTAPSVATQTTYSFSVTATDADNASVTNAYSVVVNPLPSITNASPLPAWTVNRPYSQTIAATGGTGTLSFSDNGSTLPAWLTITGGGVLSGTPPAAGPVSFTLRVTDSLSAFSSKAFSLTINPAPSVSTTSLPGTTSGIAYNQTLAETGGTTPFTWQAAGLPSWLTLSAAGVLSGTAPAEATATTFNFSVTVTDTAGAVSASQNLAVTVDPAIQITTGSPLPGTDSGLSYSQTFASSGGTGTVTWASGNLPSWLTLSAAGVLSGTAPSVGTATQYNFNVTATDSVGATGSKGFSVTVNPVVTITTASPLPAWTLNQPYSQTIAATGGIPGYTFADAGTTLPTWLAISGGGALTGTPTATGTFTFTLKVTDSAGDSNTKAFSLKINVTPSVTTTSLPATTSGLQYSQTLTATGGTGTLTFSAGGLPTWLTLTGATLGGTAATVSTATPYNFTVTVTDSTGAASAAQPLSVTVNPGLIVTTSNPLPSAGSGTAYSQTFTATGGTGAVTWTFGNRPSWLTQNGATLSGTAPTVTQPTTYNFTATATDSLGASSSAQPFNVTVSSGVIITTGASLGPWTATRPFTVTLAASGGTPPYAFADAGQTLPSWLAVTGSVLSGTPPSSGSFQFTIKATDSLGSSATKTFTLPINAVPAVTTGSLPGTTSGISYSQTLAETGGTTPFTWQATGLPGWLTLSTSGTLSGVAPVQATATTFNFSVTVTDAAGAISGSQSLSVTVDPAIQVTNASPLPATESGLSYSQTFASTGGTGALTWSSGNLPAWLNLSAAGGLTGTAPSVGVATPYNFNVTATDSVGAAGSKAFSVTVNPLVTVTTASPLPAWTMNQAYSQTIAATGGIPGYTFTDAGTTLPPWLTISASGALTGTPPATGTFTFTLKVTDSAGGSNTKAFSLKIDATPSVTTTSLPATTSGLQYSQTLTATGGTGTLTFAAAGLPSWLTLSGAALGGTAPTVSAASPYNFSVTVTDSTGAASAAQPLSVTVNPGPTITTTNPLASAGSGIAYSQTFTATGGTGAIAWTFGNRPSWLTQNGATLSGTAPTVTQPTTYNFTATATDSLGATSGAQSFSVTVSSGVIVTTGASLGPWTATRPFTVTLAASGGTAPYVFSDAGQTLPSWLILTANVLSGTPPSAGSFQFTIKAVDSLGSSTTKAFTLPINAVPAVSTTSLSAITSGLPYSQSLAATGGTAPLRWSGASLPPWLTVNGPSVLGTAPVVSTPTPYGFSVSVTDAAGAVSTSQSLSVTVNPPVTITTSSPLPTANAGTAYTVTFAASGGTGAIAWTASNLPSWLTLNGNTLSGTPPSIAAGTTVNLTIRATDSVGASASGSFQITVANGSQSGSGTLPAWTVNRPYSTALTVTGGTPPYKNWLVSTGSLPAGLQLNSTSGAIGGTPTAAGAVSFTVSATDSNSLVFLTTWSLTVNPAPAIPSQTLPPASLGTPYSQTLSHTGGTAPFTWGAQAFNSVNLNLNSAGVLAGVPNAPGTINFTATLTDAAGATAQTALSLVVEPGISITTAALPATTSTAPYSATIAATGGTGTIAFSAALPGWLSLTSQGTLTGVAPKVPTATDFDFVVTATDSVGVTTTKYLTLTVNPVPRVITAKLPAGTAAAPYSTRLAAGGGTGTLVWSAKNLPAWASLNSSGVISGTPPSAATVTISVTVTDSLSIASPPDSLALEIDPPGGVPRITTACPFGPTTAGLFFGQALTASAGYPPYNWSATGLPSWLVLNSGAFSGTAVAGAYAFTLQVADSHGQDATLGCGLNVNPTPAINATALAPGTVGAPYAQSPIATGGTGALIWSSSSLPDWLTVEPLTGVLSGTPPAPGSYTLTLQVTDSLGTVSAPASFIISVTNTGGAPIVTACPLPKGSVGTPMAFQLTAALGFPPYSWQVSGLPAGLTATSAGVVTGTPSAASNSAVGLSATDSADVSVNASCSLNISGAPAVTATSLPNGTVGAFYWQRLTATGGIGALQWSISGAPDWLTLDPLSGILSGTPDAAGIDTFTVQVTDSHGTQSPPASIAIDVTPPAPGGGITVTTTCPLPSITQSMLLDQVFTATGGAPPYSWTAMGLPTGISLDPSGTLLATPAAGLISFVVQATDQQQQQTAPLSCSVQVNPEPQITTDSLPNGIGGEPYQASLTASGGTGSRIWTAVKPYWLIVDSLSGELSGTPPAAGTVTTVLTVSDQYGISNSKSYSFTIAALASGSLPALNSACPLPGATVGLSYSDTLSAAGGVPPYQFFVSPPIAGLTFANSGVISGTPQASGSTQLEVQVVDASGSTATTPCGLAVAPSPVLTILQNTPAGKVNQVYSGGFTASGGAAPYGWSLSSGKLPPGITLNLTSGALAGTPTASGTFLFTVVVTDSNKATASANGSITIAPSLVITAPPNLPDALGGSAYQQTLTASGASGTLTWSIVGGTLPSGLTLNTTTGVISGSATQAGTFTITVQAADSSGQTALLQVTVKVDLAPIPQVTITGLSSTVTPGQQVTATVTIAAAYPLDITGVLSLAVTADPSIGLTDPAVQFAGGGTSAPFRIPANSTQGVFTPVAGFQTGTLAGTLALNVTLQTGGVSVQPPSSAAITGQIPKLAPTIVGTPVVTRTGSGLQVTIKAFATSRDVTSATFQFTGANVQTSSLTVSLSSLVGGWYSSAQSDAYGSMFQIVQPFTVTGTPSQVTGVTIMLTNSVGNSTPVTVSF